MIPLTISFLIVWIIVGIMLVAFFFTKSKPRDIPEANELLRERNTISRNQQVHLSRIAAALEKLTDQDI